MTENKKIDAIKLKDFLIKMMYEIYQNSPDYRKIKIREIEEIFYDSR